MRVGYLRLDSPQGAQVSFPRNRYPGGPAGVRNFLAREDLILQELEANPNLPPYRVRYGTKEWKRYMKEKFST